MKHLPKINFFYWALIISANTFGETAGDLISQTFKLGYGGGTIALLLLFLIALAMSIYSKSSNLFIRILSYTPLGRLKLRILLNWKKVYLTAKQQPTQLY